MGVLSSILGEEAATIESLDRNRSFGLKGGIVILALLTEQEVFRFLQLFLIVVGDCGEVGMGTHKYAAIMVPPIIVVVYKLFN